MSLIKKLIGKLLLSWSPSFDKRVLIVGVGLACYICFICRQTYQTVVVDKEHYETLIKNLRTDSVSIQQLRGVIYSETGEMIAASLPRYDVYFDFRNVHAEGIRIEYDSVTHKRRRVPTTLLPKDTLDYYFSDNGPAALYLYSIDPSKTPAAYARGVREAYARLASRYRVLHNVSYLNWKKMQRSAPFFSKDPNHIGLFGEERPHRYRPYGELRMASSTIGGVFPNDTFRVNSVGVLVNKKGHGRNGIEAGYDSLLAGTPGLGYVQKIRNKRTVVVQSEPINGADVYTTLDMEMQTILDNELNRRILELNAVGGWAAVMEVKTGKIKAISNLRRFGDHCSEDYNHFVRDLYDPGSTFKTVSYMVLLDDGKIDPDTYVDTGNYENNPNSWNYHGKEIRDDHPVGRVTAQEAMVQSSNISLAKLTTQAYERNPQHYLDLIDGMKIFADMQLYQDFPGAEAPRKRKVGDSSWSKVSLAQISYGYETQIPGMYMLNFYNAIANDGKLMRPYIVDRIVKDGEVIVQHEPQVINASICKSTTLKQVRAALEGVVEHGTARSEWNSRGVMFRQGAASRKVKIAGKTGTAQRFDHGNYDYNNGHYVSFAGYFPADDPQYSCIVVMNVRPPYGGRPGGGYMAGPVFRNFAEQVYARSCYRTLDDVRPDSANLETMGFYPWVKGGESGVINEVLRDLNLSEHRGEMNIKNIDYAHQSASRVPDVKGLGATDALFMLEKLDLRVTIIGHGRVVAQSIPAGSAAIKGQTISLTLK